MGWKCTLRNVRKLLIVEPSVASRAFWRTRHMQKHSNLIRLVLQHSKTNQNAKTALVRLAFLINAHQNANQKPIGSVPAYRVQCILPPQPICQTLLFDISRVWFWDYPKVGYLTNVCEASITSSCLILRSKIWYGNVTEYLWVRWLTRKVWDKCSSLDTPYRFYIHTGLCTSLHEFYSMLLCKL